MNIFIDTNVFLSFYHLSSDDLGELKKLAVLARRGDIKLFLPDQVVDEFRRNRANKIADAMKKLRDQRIGLQFPQICRQYTAYAKLREAQAEYEKHHAILIERIEADIASSTLEADKVVEELFTAARVVATPSDLVERARIRTDLGKPPGKRGSLGDAINWELVLANVPVDEDLYFLTDDADYFSALDANSLDPYLVDEWSRNKRSRLLLYKRISAFFAGHFPHIELGTEKEKDRLIEELASSRKFAQTQDLIRKLSQFSDFSNAQTNEILGAAVSNDQVYWIADRPDVRRFLDSIVSGREAQLDQENLRRLRYVLHEMKPYGRIPF